MAIARTGLVAIVLAASQWMAVTPVFAADSLAARVQRLEDTREIHDLLIRYGLMLDGKDFHGYSELFSRDAVWIGGFGTFYTKGTEGKPVPQMAGHYDDEFIREDGHWKFLRRVAQGDIPYMDPLIENKP